MKLEEKTDLLARTARLLYTHAHPTDDLVAVTSRLGAALVSSSACAGELQIEVTDESGSGSRAMPAPFVIPQV